jgi:hypothetical protein
VGRWMHSCGGSCGRRRDSFSVVDFQASCSVCRSGIPFSLVDCDLLRPALIANCWARGLSILDACGVIVHLVWFS